MAPADLSDETERRGGRDRRAHRTYRFIDHRRGFDRRVHPTFFETIRDRPRILIAMLVSLNLLSFIDGYLTATELRLGIAYEGNPLLRALALNDPRHAAIVKFAALLLVSFGIWYGRDRKIFLEVAVGATIVFALVLVLHIAYLEAYGLL